MNRIRIAIAAVSIIDIALVKTRFQFSHGLSASRMYMKLIIEEMNISRKPSYRKMIAWFQKIIFSIALARLLQHMLKWPRRSVTGYIR